MRLLKKSVYDKLAAKVNNIDTNDFVLSTKYNTDKSESEKKILDNSGLVKKTDYNIKLTELENKIPDVSNLATKTALTAREKKIPSISSLVKKKQTMTQILESLKKNLLIMIMTNILLLQSLII